MPFANISISEGKNGVVSNEAGKFQLRLPAGKHQLDLYYVGYQKKTIQLRIEADTTLKIWMQKEVYSLEDVVITGNRKPAERIIQKVIEKRKQYLKTSREWEAETYVKGSFRLIDAPEKLFGQTIGGMDSIRALDERAFIYLSETQSIMTYMDNEVKETITASKLSGNENLPSFNTGLLININLYKNEPVILQGASVVSPVSNQAFQFYNYSYQGKRTEAGATIHSIKIIPKRTEEPCVSGVIEILDSLWMIHSFHGETTGSKINYEVFDTLRINQTYSNTKGFYYLEQSSVLLNARLFGFETKGAFMGQFTTLATEKNNFSQILDDVLISYDSYALEVDSIAWSSIRKIGLSDEEQKDYQLKDSLYQLENDPSNLDSLRRLNNKYNPVEHLQSRYTYLFSDYRTSFSIAGLLSTLTFNPVQGFQINNGIELKKKLGDSEIQNAHWRYYCDVNYGFADGILRYQLGYDYLSDNRSSWDWSIKAGQQIRELNNYRSMSPFLNSTINIVLKEHFHRYYDSRFGELDIKFKRIKNTTFKLNISYESRRPVINRSQWSTFRKDRDYAENTPQHEDLAGQADLLSQQDALILVPEIIYQPGERYIDYPNSRIILRSKWPLFRFSARIGAPLIDASASFTELYMTLEDEINLGPYGSSRLFVAASSFLNTSELSFYDYRHFSGNDFSIADFDYERSFLMLPIYERSTDGNSLQINFEHNFSGYLLNKLPVVRNMGLESVVRFSRLEANDQSSYSEFSIGIDRIGFKIFRPLRFDFVWQYDDGQLENTGWIIGITQTLNVIRS